MVTQAGSSKEKQVSELSAVRQTLQADLETSIRRIADLQAALEEVQSSDESDTESVQTARESLSSKQETESQLSLGSSWSLNLEPEGSIQSWSASTSGWSSPSGTSLAGTLPRQPVDSHSTQSLRINKDPGRSPPALSSLSVKRRESGRNGREEDLGKVLSPSLGAQRWECGKLVSREESDLPPSVGSVSPSVVRKWPSPAASTEGTVSPSVVRKTSPAADGKWSRSSSALSEYVEELRRQRLKDKEAGALARDEASSLPIYQTTGASVLRRCRTLQEEEDYPVKPDKPGESGGAGLTRSSSLRSVSLEGKPRPAPSPILKRVSQFGSYDSLVQNIDEAYAELSSPAPGGDTLGALRQKPWRSSLAASLEGATDTALGQDPLVFQSKRFGDAMSQGKDSDPFSWEIPTLSYERKTNTEVDDILPAIRRAQSASSLSRGPRERKEGHRPMSVHFEDQISTECPASPSRRPKEDPGNLSDSSSSSSSVVSFKSADSIKSRPRIQRLEGEGCVEKGNATSAKEGGRSEADGKDDDVNSIMMKYLGKE